MLEEPAANMFFSGCWLSAWSGDEQRLIHVL